MKNLIIIAIVLLSGCTVQQKCDRIRAKADKLPCFTKDTIVKYTTIRGFRVDTFVKYSEKKEIDTLFVDSGGVKVRTIIKWKERTVFQEVSKKDTVIKTVTVYDCPKPKPVVDGPVKSFLISSGKFFWGLLLFLAISFGLIRYFEK